MLRALATDSQPPSLEFEALFNQSPGLFLVLTPQFQIAAVSNAYLKATMTKREDILGRNIFDVFPDNPNDPAADGVANVRASLHKVLRLRVPDTLPVQRYDIRRPTSERGTFETRYWKPSHWPVFDQKGAITHIIHCVEDATQTRKTDQALQKSEEKFKIFISSIREYAIFMLDLNGYVTTWNGGGQNITGYHPDEIIGKHFSFLHPPEDIKKNKPSLELAIAQEKGKYEEEGIRIRKDGSSFIANVVLVALHDESGELFGFGKITKDITESKRAESALKRAKESADIANHELESFCYAVAHDLRAPLRSLDGFSQILLEDYQEKIDAEGKTYLQKLRSGTQRLGELIDDLLRLSRVSRTELRNEATDLSAIAQDIARRLKEENPSRHVEFNIEPGLKVIGDKKLLEAALENLLGNAWKYTANHASAKIEVGRMTNAEGETIFFVRDDGAGFDMAYSDKLFGAFQRLHSTQQFPGTGVGLATVHRIIRRHGGRIWANAEVEGGATFYFTLNHSK